MDTAAAKRKQASSSIFSFSCGCNDAKSVAVSRPRSGGSSTADPDAASLSRRHHPGAPLSTRPETSSGDTATLTTPTTSTSRDGDGDDDGTSFSGLLRQLTELERSVAAWERRHEIAPGWTRETGEVGGTGEVVGEKTHNGGDAPSGDGGRENKSSQKGGRRHHFSGRRHRRSQSEGAGGRMGKVGESVAVVKQTEDPLGDFRRSMLQMIIEKEILSGEELQQLLCRFLSLNSPSHHALIVRAFADIWRDVFSGTGDDDGTDLFLLPPSHHHQHHQQPPPHRQGQVGHHG